MIIDFLKAKEFEDFDVFLFLGFPKGFTINKTFLIQFVDYFQEIKGDFNIDVWRIISSGNVVYKDILSYITRIEQGTKEDLDESLWYLLRKGLIIRVGTKYSDVYNNIKKYKLIRQGYRYDFGYNGDSFAIRIEGEDKELDAHQRLIWKLADGKSSVEDIIKNINTQIKNAFPNHNAEIATIKLAVAILFCVRNRYTYLI